MSDWLEHFSFIPTLPLFSGSCGLHVSVQCHAPFDFLNQFVTEDFLNSIVITEGIRELNDKQNEHLS